MRGTGAGVGVGMLRGGRGVPYLKIKRFLGFLVSLFLGFFASSFLGFNVSWFLCLFFSWSQSFKVSKNQHNSMFFWKTLTPYQQSSISCFLEDIDPIFKILRIS